MKLTLDDKTYQADVLSLYRLSLDEARTIKRQTGMTFADWKFGLLTYFREDPDVLLGVAYVMKRRSGEVVDWAELSQLSAQDIIDGLEWEASDQEITDKLQVDKMEAEWDAPARDADGESLRPAPESEDATEGRG